MGSGTTAVSALKSGRYFTGYEISEDYLKLANKRIDPFLNQPALDLQYSEPELTPEPEC